MKNKNSTLQRYEVRIFNEAFSVDATSIYSAKKIASRLFKTQHENDKIIKSISISGLIAGAHVKLWK